MKTIVIYHTETGFTKEYAEWIAAETGADCMNLKDAKKADLTPYDNMVFGSHMRIGTVHKIKWFKKHMEEWHRKKLIVFCVGAGPIDGSSAKTALEKNYGLPVKPNLFTFYCPGGFRFEKMSWTSAFFIKMLKKGLDAKKQKDKEDKELLRMLQKSCDFTNKKYIEPIVSCIKANIR